MTTLTHLERKLLRHLVRDIGPFLAAPMSWIENKRSSGHTGGGHGFNFQYSPKSVSGQWFEWLPENISKPGASCYGELLSEVTMPYARLDKWRRSLPTSVLDQAAVWWRTYPVNTRDLEALARLTLEQLADEPTLFDVD
jgi:hypothetical protein